MYETETELRWLQDLIEGSFARSGAHLRSIMSERYRVDAVATARYLQGIRHLVLSTVTAKGEPRVSPVDGLFVHGRFHLSSDASAVKVRHLRARPAVSAAHAVGDDVAVVVHGTAEVIQPGHDSCAALDEVWRGIYESTPRDWSPDGVYVRIEPATMFTYCRERSLLGEAG